MIDKEIEKICEKDRNCEICIVRKYCEMVL